MGILAHVLLLAALVCVLSCSFTHATLLPEAHTWLERHAGSRSAASDGHVDGDFVEIQEESVSSVGEALSLMRPGGEAARNLRGVPHAKTLAGTRRALEEGVCDETEYNCELAADILVLVNELRQGEGKDPVCLNNKLNSAAKAHTEDMVENKFFAHRGSDGSRVTNRIEDAGFNWQACAENIASGFQGSPAVMSAWERSSGHRRNILGDYTHMGVYRKGGKWTQVFARNSGESCDNASDDNPASDSTPPPPSPPPAEDDTGAAPAPAPSPYNWDGSADPKY